MSNLYGTPSAFLPLPRIPSRPKGPSADLLASVVGEELAAPLREAEALHEQVRAAVEEVERRRPGVFGHEWKAALEADAADLAAGRTPSKWRAAKLLEDDPQRWVTARLKCGAFPQEWKKIVSRLDRDAIRRAAEIKAAAIGAEFAKVAEQAWKHHENPHRAWPLVAEGEQLLTENRVVREVLTWGTVAVETSLLVHDASSLPGGPIAAGHWIATSLALNPKKRLIGIPKGVVWPTGADRLVGLAVPAGAPTLAMRGYIEKEEVL